MLLSVIVCSYKMNREIPRTLLSLTPWFQRVDPACYEVLLIQNSDESLHVSGIDDIAPNFRSVTPSRILPSPCFAINETVRQHAAGNLVLIIIDGARISSPGVVRTSLEISQNLWGPKVVGYAPAYHLGWALQSQSAQHGYDQTTEDAMLKRIGWSNSKGYDLFQVSAQAASMRNCFTLPAESNCYLLSKEFFLEIGGYDEGFLTPGGGLCNLEFFQRSVGLSDRVICMFQEGSFHQIHGGASTNAIDKTLQNQREQSDLNRLGIRLDQEEFTRDNLCKLRFYSTAENPKFKEIWKAGYVKSQFRKKRNFYLSLNPGGNSEVIDSVKTSELSLFTKRVPTKMRVAAKKLLVRVGLRRVVDKIIELKL